MTYRTVAARATAEFTEKRSRFIAELSPAADADAAAAFIEDIRRRNRDARHHVYAYRIPNGPERFSDDGEPQGTAGSPLMETLRRAQVTGAVLVVTRYFGGILLGAGGLTRAYAHAASLAVTAAKIVEKRPFSKISFVCSYAQYEQACALARRFGGEAEDAAFTQDVRVIALVPEENTDGFCRSLELLTAGTADAKVENGFYH